jgi:subtilisin family serine protease
VDVAGQLALKCRRLTRLAAWALVLVAMVCTALASRGTASSAAIHPAANSVDDHIRGARPGRASAAWSKLDSRLSALIDPKAARTLTTASKWHSTAIPTVKNGNVLVEIETRRPAATQASVVTLGGSIQASWHGLIEALVPKSSLAALSRVGSVRYVRPPLHGVSDDVPGEEVQASLAAALHAKGITGKGTKVAIIDGSFAGLSDRQASGDLPTDVVTQDFCGGQFGSGEGHGTAVAEIVHEMAPDAQLYLICFGDLPSLAAAEAYVKSQGIPIVSFSVEYFNAGRGDGGSSDPVDAIVSDARANGILWVNSAGNDAFTHWSGTFNDSNGDRIHEWDANGDAGNTFVAANGEGVCGFLKWDEWPVAKSDFDLVLFDSATGAVISGSTDVQNGTQPPVEETCAHNGAGGDALWAWAIIGQHVVSSPRLDLYVSPIPPPYLQYQSAGGSIGDPASSPSAVAVGAVCWQDNGLEPYSSQGPTVDGRTKPDIAGHDSVSSATFGSFSGICPSGFAGTSASSPELAGAAALVKQANPEFTATQLQTFLQQNATDVGPPGPDDQTGAGVLHLPDLVIVQDTTAPKARALASSGKRGRVVRLLSRVSDDSGQVKIREQVKQSGRVIKTLTSGFVAATSGQTDYFNWKAPAKIRGPIQHCVRGQDRAGNLSLVSCAKVTLSG